MTNIGTDAKQSTKSRLAAMNTDEFVALFYDHALRIHAICLDLNLPTSDAKLLTYIHIKASRRDAAATCLDKTDIEAIKALNILLGRTDLDQQKANLIFERLSEIDARAKTEFGLEFPMRYELENRLRFHEDPEYRRSKLEFYQNEIKPRMEHYDASKISSSFRRNRTLISDIQRRLDRLF